MRTPRWTAFVCFLLFGIVTPTLIAGSFHHGPPWSEDPIARVVGNTVNLRAEPSTQASVVTKVHKGERVDVVETRGEWLRVRTSTGVVGWGMARYFEILSSSAPEPITPSPRPSPPPEPTRGSERIRTRSASPGPSPSPSSSSFHVGIQVGGALGTLAGFPDPPDPGFRTGFQAGLFGEYDASTLIEVSLAMLYTMKGGTRSVNAETRTFQFDYLEIPLSLRLVFQPTRDLDVYLAAGPVLSVLLHAALSTSGPNGGTFTVQDVAPLDYGISAGLGARTHLLGQRFFVEGRYGVGLASIHDVATDPLDLSHRTITMCLGWYVP